MNLKEDKPDSGGRPGETGGTAPGCTTALGSSWSAATSRSRSSGSRGIIALATGRSSTSLMDSGKRPITESPTTMAGMETTAENIKSPGSGGVGVTINHRPSHAVGPSKSNAPEPMARPSARHKAVTVDCRLSMEKSSTPSTEAKHCEPIYPDV